MTHEVSNRGINPEFAPAFSVSLELLVVGADVHAVEHHVREFCESLLKADSVVSVEADVEQMPVESFDAIDFPNVAAWREQQERFRRWHGLPEPTKRAQS